MTDWRDLPLDEKIEVDKLICDEIPMRHHINESSGFEWDEPDWTLQNVHMGHYCAECWRPEHICLCSHNEDQ